MVDTKKVGMQIKSVGLEGKIELFWNQEKGRMETADKMLVKVKSLGSPILVVSSYDLHPISQGYDPYVGGTAYSFGEATHTSTSLVGDKSLLEKAKYFCKGTSFATEDFPKSETIITPIILYAGSKR